MSSNLDDWSFICVESGDCANLTDAIYGRVEGKDLQCLPAGIGNMAHCTFEERFVAIDGPNEISSEWSKAGGDEKRLVNGQWRAA